MSTTRFLRHNNLVNIFLFILIIFVFLQNSAVATRDEDKLAELSSKEEELVKWASYGEEKLSTVVITGKLLCHLAHAHHKLPSHPNPVSGSSMGVFCGTSGRKKRSWAKGSTNSYGEFIIDLPSHLHAIPNLEKICVVKVLHLPKSSPCRHAFTGKHKGIKLTSLAEGVRLYTTRNIHLITRPSQEHMRKGSKTEHTISTLLCLAIGSCNRRPRLVKYNDVQCVLFGGDKQNFTELL